MPTFFNFILIATGAFSFWAVKGFRGKFNDEMIGPYDLTSRKRKRNLIIGSLVIGFILLIIFTFYKSSQSEPRVIVLESISPK